MANTDAKVAFFAVSRKLLSGFFVTILRKSIKIPKIREKTQALGTEKAKKTKKKMLIS